MVRWFRRGDMELEPNDDQPLRIELIRELVDELPDDQYLAVSLLFFGGGNPTQAQVAEELGLSEYKLKEVITNALRNLREALQEEDRVGSLRTDDDPRIRSLFSTLALGDHEDSA